MINYLIVNTGSSSKKYALYTEGKELFKLHFEHENGDIAATTKIGEKSHKTVVSQAQYESSLKYLLEVLLSNKVISDKGEITAIGVRIVAPGNYFLENRIIDEKYIVKLQEARQQAPLHLEPITSEIEKIKSVLPGIPMMGISDSAFHSDLSPQARLYNLPDSMAAKFGIYRFGYHGIAAQSVVNKLKILLGSVPPRTILCHLGSGSSIHAVKDGKSFDTSMGFTPLEGVTMGTRIGNIDAGAVLYLLQKSGMSPTELENYFNTECGLLGLSGKTPDIRELIELEKSGNAGAKTALDAFIYSVRKYIGAYAAAMNGLDLLVFTATIGERSSIIRERICRGLTGLGVVIDNEQNDQTISRDGLIHKEKESSVKVAVTVTDEMGQMAKETVALCDPATS